MFRVCLGDLVGWPLRWWEEVCRGVGGGLPFVDDVLDVLVVVLVVVVELPGLPGGDVGAGCRGTVALLAWVWLLAGRPVSWCARAVCAGQCSARVAAWEASLTFCPMFFIRIVA